MKRSRRNQITGTITRDKRGDRVTGVIESTEVAIAKD